MNKLSFEDVIAQRGELIYTHVGDSMYPLIREDRDLLVIKAISAPLKRLDIPLYKRADGRYILHRIVKTGNDGFVICGDNCLDREYDVRDDMIIGVLTDIIRNGKKRSVYSVSNRIYAHLWCDTFIIRRLFMALRRLYGRVIGRYRKAKN